MMEEALSGVALIAQERERQTSAEGWTSWHDDHHAEGEMALAGAIYAWPHPRPTEMVTRQWPWSRSWWKPAKDPSDAEQRIRELVKAGALIAAEIDRLQRLPPGVGPVWRRTRA